MIAYLASPYSHPDAAVREQRFRSVCCATAEMIRAGQLIFSPIVHSHPLVDYGMPAEWDFWQKHDREYLSRCDELLVLMLPGWRESVGVQAEIRMAEEMGKPIRYIAWDEDSTKETTMTIDEVITKAVEMGYRVLYPATTIEQGAGRYDIGKTIQDCVWSDRGSFRTVQHVSLYEMVSLVGAPESEQDQLVEDLVERGVLFEASSPADDAEEVLCFWISSNPEPGEPAQ